MSNDAPSPSAFDRFEVVPAVDVQDGEVVQLVGGERGTGRTYGDPVTAAERWVDAGARTLHLIDLDGAFEGTRANADAVAAVVDTLPAEVEVQVGGGIRTAKGAMELLDIGVDRVVLGTAALEDPDIVARITESHPASVVVGLDATGGEVVVEGWTEGTGLSPVEVAGRYADLGACAILFTNVDVEGQLGGVSLEPVRELVDTVDIPVIVSGGVASVDDVVALQEAGAGAVVVGTALYEGRVSLAEAMDAVGQ